MTLPNPVPGLVARYSYLWRREQLAGREEGQKDRPCAIVAALRVDENGDTRVLLLPITPTPPDQPALAVEIPRAVKRRLKLDDASSWVVLSEWNAFVWPGPDLRPLPGAGANSVTFGMLPPSLFAAIRDRFLAIARSGASHGVKRTE